MTDQKSKEYQIFPGVYVSNLRPKPVAKLAEETLESLKDPKNKLDVIDLDINEIENAIRHLQRSNSELQDAYNEDHDPIYKEAIDENKLAITIKQKRIEELKLIKANLIASNPHYQEGKIISESSHSTPQIHQTTSSLSTESAMTTTTTTTTDTSQLPTEKPKDNEEGVFL